MPCIRLFHYAVAAGQHLLAALGPEVRARVDAPVLHGFGVHRGPGAVGLLHGLTAHRVYHLVAYLVHRGVYRNLGLLGLGISGLGALRYRGVAGLWHIGGLWLRCGGGRSGGLRRPHRGLAAGRRGLLYLRVVAPAGDAAGAAGALKLLCGGNVALHRVKGAPGRYAHRHQAHSQRQVKSVAPCLIFRKAFAVHKFASFQG